MESTLRPEVQELVRLREQFASQDAVLTVQESEAVVRCARKLEVKVLPDRRQADGPILDPTSHRLTDASPA
jgi:hypothetical protein